MEPTWVEIAGVTVRAPVSAGSNLLLTILCGAYAVRLRAAVTRRAQLWGGFFLLMALATFAGVFKHGARHVIPGSALTLLLATSNLATGVATHLAQQAAIASHAAAGRVRGYQRLARAQLGLFVLANVLLGPEMVLLIVNTAIGLLPVIAVEAVHRTAVPGAGLVSLGLGISILTGLVYAWGLSFGRWFNHIDVTHVLMGVSFVVIYRGVRRGEDTWR